MGRNTLSIYQMQYLRKLGLNTNASMALVYHNKHDDVVDLVFGKGLC